MNTNEFTEKSVEQTLTDYLFGQVSKDKDSIALPKEMEQAMKNLMELRNGKGDTPGELSPARFDTLQLPRLISIQNELIQNKYYIARELAVLVGAQSYAYIFRKYQSASQWSPTKDRLGTGRTKAPTVGEIESEIEKELVTVRKTEVAYQVMCDRIKILIEWVDDCIMNVQNRIRTEENNRRMQFAEENRTYKQ